MKSLYVILYTIITTPLHFIFLIIITNLVLINLILITLTILINTFRCWGDNRPLPNLAQNLRPQVSTDDHQDVIDHYHVDYGDDVQDVNEKYEKV